MIQLFFDDKEAYRLDTKNLNMLYEGICKPKTSSIMYGFRNGIKEYFQVNYDKEGDEISVEWINEEDVKNWILCYFEYELQVKVWELAFGPIKSLID